MDSTTSNCVSEIKLQLQNDLPKKQHETFIHFHSFPKETSSKRRVIYVSSLVRNLLEFYFFSPFAIKKIRFWCRQSNSEIKEITTWVDCGRECRDRELSMSHLEAFNFGNSYDFSWCWGQKSIINGPKNIKCCNLWMNPSKISQINWHNTKFAWLHWNQLIVVQRVWVGRNFAKLYSTCFYLFLRTFLAASFINLDLKSVKSSWHKLMNS